MSFWTVTNLKCDRNLKISVGVYSTINNSSGKDIIVLKDFATWYTLRPIQKFNSLIKLCSANCYPLLSFVEQKDYLFLFLNKN